MSEENRNNQEQPFEQEPYDMPNDGRELDEVMSIGQWLLIAIAMAIPCVNIIMVFVWGFGNGNKNRANYCKAAIILFIIEIILGFILGQVMSSVIANMAGSVPAAY